MTVRSKNLRSIDFDLFGSHFRCQEGQVTSCIAGLRQGQLRMNLTKNVIEWQGAISYSRMDHIL